MSNKVCLTPDAPTHQSQLWINDLEDGWSVLELQQGNHSTHITLKTSELQALAKHVLRIKEQG